MNDDEVLAALRAEEKRLTPVELAELLGSMIEGGVSYSAIVSYFKRAFPSTPLRVLLDSGLWWRVSNGGLGDEWFNDHLGPWLGRCSGTHER